MSASWLCARCGNTTSPRLCPACLLLLQSDDATNVRAAAASALGKYVYLGELEELNEKALHEIEDVLIEKVRAAMP